mmetsp:Transcript_52819/g.123554  ORF Transcript_52819/g.123554 Transcript_52819/m.123554 type:complete len:142 (-) Transcript_52819:416-841(-)
MAPRFARLSLDPLERSQSIPVQISVQADKRKEEERRDSTHYRAGQQQGTRSHRQCSKLHSKHRAERSPTQGTAKRCPEEHEVNEKQPRSIITFADTGIQPQTMVVKATDAFLTALTMLQAGVGFAHAFVTRKKASLLISGC